MVKKSKKKKLSGARLARARRQARINFGFTKRRKNNPTRKVARKKRSTRRSNPGRATARRLMGLAVGAGLYGAFRNFISNLVGGFTRNLPLGGFADELVLGTIGYQMARRGRMQLTKDIGLSALAVEAARVGQILLAGGLTGLPGARATAAPMVQTTSFG